jgi:hypothetical protein
VLGYLLLDLPDEWAPGGDPPGRSPSSGQVTTRNVSYDAAIRANGS